MAATLQIGALLLLVLATVASALDVGVEGAAEPGAQTPQAHQQQVAADEGKEDAAATTTTTTHTRDKRRLPDPGFIIPITPMGFTKKDSQGQRVTQLQQVKQGQQGTQEVKSNGGKDSRGFPPTPLPPLVLAAERMTTPSASPRSGTSSSAEKEKIPDSMAVSSQSRPKKMVRYAWPRGRPEGRPSGRVVARQAGHPAGHAMRQDHLRAVSSFLDQTRKLGVPDEQALKLLDKELAKAKRQGPSYRPVYHATPLKPFGALIDFNQAPYEKRAPGAPMKPIKEQQVDVPPPAKPLVVESERQHLPVDAATTTSNKHTEAVVTPVGPLPVAVPMQLDPVHLLQTAQAAESKPDAGRVDAPLQHTEQAFQVSLPLPTYQPSDLGVGALLHSAPLHQQAVNVVDVHSQVPALSLHSLHALSAAYGAATANELPPPSPVPLPVHLPQQHELAVAHEPLQVAHHPVYVTQAQVELPVATAAVAKEPAQVQVQVQDHNHGDDQQPDEYASQYRFGYRVRDDHAGNDFGHVEASDGKTTKGEYFVTLPDGRLQSVRYWADPSGYHAHITYTSHAAHPGPAGPAGPAGPH